MVLIFEIHKDFVHERLCKFTPEIEVNRTLSFLWCYGLKRMIARRGHAQYMINEICYTHSI